MDLRKKKFLKQRDPLESYYNNLGKRWWENDNGVKKYLIKKACTTWGDLGVIVWEKGRRQSQGIIWGAGKKARFYLKGIERNEFQVQMFKGSARKKSIGEVFSEQAIVKTLKQNDFSQIKYIL